MSFHVIIPARLHSTRLPKKVLADIAGKPMIQHVYESAKQSGASQIVIATDHEEVAEACEAFGARVCMTAESHQSGTERVAEAVMSLGFDENDVIIGLQADEPMMQPQLIAQLANNLLDNEHVKSATLAMKLKTTEELFNPNVVKVVLNYRNYALYFSRASIPWDRAQFDGDHKMQANLSDVYFRHIGLYGYRASFLENYISWPVSPIEKLESLEQLRILWNGHKMHVGVVNAAPTISVDTQEDLEKVRELISK